ncbi:RNA polymerase sigma factor [Lewinella sp. 4G2]|uniref:RNA polymerase sigma factor n=1 Tax=Lewinella sp. 4G2 TaxID=1803372 RepID=UPI0007B4AA30|nr:RNA polymerase sigma factor [Lewinella sp. 4G2]OAV46178.1 hypothetical protein A3850_018130 [Lewinella sp. 4G2]
MAPHADQRYLRALRENDSATVNELYQQSFPKIVTWVKRNNGSEDDAADLFQEALVSLYHSAHKPGYTLTCPIGALIFSICRNRWIDQLRKKNKEQKVREVEVARYDSEDRVASALEIEEEAALRKRKLDTTMAQLSATCQDLLKLLAKGTKPAEAAEKLGMSNANTVYRRKNACLQRWRELLTALDRHS